jgi:hypothetical protein
VSEDILNQLAYFVHNEERMPAGLIRTVIEEIERLRSEVRELEAALPDPHPQYVARGSKKLSVQPNREVNCD